MSNPSPSPALANTAAKSVLVRIDTVQTFRGLAVQKIKDLMDEGELLWVWDLSKGSQRGRQLRFLALEVFAPDTTRGLALDDALRLILGETRENFRGSEIAQRLRLNRSSVHHLHHGGQLAGTVARKTLFVPRTTLEKFLRERWIGAVNPAGKVSTA